MRVLHNAIISVLIVMGIGAACFAGDIPVSIRTSLDKKEVTIGEKIRYTVTVSADKKINIEFPDLSGAFKDLAVADSGEKTGGFFNRRTRTLWVVLQSFTPGKYTILKQAIKYKVPDKDWAIALTDECVVTVVSLVDKAGEGAQLADIKGPLDMRTAMPVIILLTVLALALVIIFRKKIFPAKKKPAAPVEPWKAHEIAYAQLEELKRQGFLASGMIKQYYSRLSDILRHYLENRFSLKAPEMTTEEFIIYVREYSELAREQKDLLKEFLMNCDLVKFARHIPPQAEGEAAFDTTKRFVDQTKAAEPESQAAPQKR